MKKSSINTFFAIIALLLCSTSSKPMAIDYERLSKQSDDMLRQEIFPNDYEQQSLDEKIQNVHHYKTEIEKAYNVTRIEAKIYVDNPQTSLSEMLNILYKLEVFPRIISIYGRELNMLKQEKEKQE